MLAEQLPSFIEALPIPPEPGGSETAESAPKVEINDLPDGIVSGSTMIGFEPDLSSELRKSISLCLTAAQKVAQADPVVVSPRLWVDRHDMILRGLNWVSTGGGTVFTDHAVSNVAVHKAIIPFLSAAFAPAASASSLIVTAIKQMKKMDEEAPWITLYERESRRFDVSEYRFATAATTNDTVVLRIAAARFVAQQERIQVLFFKKNDVDVQFQLASRTMTANPGLLEDMNAPLERKLKGHTEDFIDGIQIGS
ncbi:hypothetical protein [Limimaricola pyoseonensis]|uniref:Uncharacterized protein n=1 Tax=Limimaricola pyoseonensis TaxID=521013 RepID=A0A1G7LFJ5_9RHOB|nr:hypothetical protein [Limimaricola pyoseonensis]SDF48332.1 hypothetical protein SAMN04488567_0469 [Limimaricola pyoseonensis]